jgi:hypothetical protein
MHRTLQNYYKGNTWRALPVGCGLAVGLISNFSLAPFTRNEHFAAEIAGALGRRGVAGKPGHPRWTRGGNRESLMHRKTMICPTLYAGNFAEQYLKERAVTLSWTLQSGTNNTHPVGDTLVQPQSGTPFNFEDFTGKAITAKMRVGGDSVNAFMSLPLGDFNLIESLPANDEVWVLAA